MPDSVYMIINNFQNSTSTFLSRPFQLLIQYGIALKLFSKFDYYAASLNCLIDKLLKSPNSPNVVRGALIDGKLIPIAEIL